VPGPARRGRPHRLTAAREFQVLALRVVLRAEDPALLDQLEFLAQDALQERPAERVVTYAVQRTEEGYALTEDGEPCGVEFHAGGVVLRLFERIYSRALALLGDATVIQGATGVAGGRRFLLVGEPGSGLTSLAIRLLLDGAAVEGAELAVLAGGELTALPRPFCLRRGHAALLPELASHWEAMPQVVGVGPPGEADSRLWAFRPDAAGFPWRITTGPVDLIVDVRAGHGSATRLSEVARYEMARVVGSRCLASPGRPASRTIAEIAGAVDRADCLRLDLGDLAAGAAALQPALRAAVPPPGTRPLW
jgi:hypothetical protein